jgi:hypothetical protein
MFHRKVFSGNDTGNKKMTRQAHEHHSALNWAGEFNQCFVAAFWHYVA